MLPASDIINAEADWQSPASVGFFVFSLNSILLLEPLIGVGDGVVASHRDTFLRQIVRSLLSYNGGWRAQLELSICFTNELCLGLTHVKWWVTIGKAIK
jgi:hypothetical protein